MVCPSLAQGVLPVPGSARVARPEDEGDDQADEREGLGERGAEERVGPGEAGRLGLAGGRLDVGGPDDPDADARADRGEAVADRADAADELRRDLRDLDVHAGWFLLCRSPGQSPGGWPGVVSGGAVREPAPRRPFGESPLARWRSRSAGS